jgi:hypothetical protein
VSQYRVAVGPEAFLPPSAAMMGISLPDPGEGNIEGVLVPEIQAIEEAARRLSKAKVPTFFPGPLVLWKWNEKSAKMAKVIKRASVEGGINIIPMTDYRPKYPKIDPETEINPNHPNLTIWHNKIDACLFVGVHCHQANLALKIIRGGTDCFTMAFCSFSGHEDANLSVRDTSPETFELLTDFLIKMRSNSKGF